jgi:hypothetical protein
MQLVTRAQWGALAPKANYTRVDSTLGVKVHYEGTNVPSDLILNHNQCADRVADIQRSHMANKAEGYIDIAYSAMVCPHGYVYEGRGLHNKTGANGNGTLNTNHYAVCAMVGDSGLTQPTDAMLNGLRDAIEWFQSQGGAGSEIKGHRDGYATSCPGEPLYSWVKNGAPRPSSGTVPTEPKPTPAPPTRTYGPEWKSGSRFLTQTSLYSDQARTWQQMMRNRGWSITVDGIYGPASANVCRQFQAEKGLSVDGVVGPQTWEAARTLPTS